MGAVFEVYRDGKRVFYQECLEKELTLRSTPFVPHKELRLFYKDEPLQQTYKPDFICYEKIIVEIKAVKEIAPEHKAQVFRKLKPGQFHHYPTSKESLGVFRVFRVKRN
jgi:GxxExxY protein